MMCRDLEAFENNYNWHLKTTLSEHSHLLGLKEGSRSKLSKRDSNLAAPPSLNALINIPPAMPTFNDSILQENEYVVL